uniref:Uncharacterized protein n=1 Tax=Molossus molossus TaxID=27622 RepID=A0A7J8BME0_MOLMO|nr:hypothetical protein HJG59_010146 [Molossus molossus]
MVYVKVNCTSWSHKKMTVKFKLYSGACNCRHLSAHPSSQITKQLYKFLLSTMKDFLWVLLITAGVVFSIFFFITENPFDTTSFLSLEEKELVAWQRARMQLIPGRTHHLQAFKDMQKNSETLKNVNSHILIGAPPVEKSVISQVWEEGEVCEIARDRHCTLWDNGQAHQPLDQVIFK